jgi:hypothetical protein
MRGAFALWDKEHLEEMELRRQHNERMRRAGEEFGRFIDSSAERKEEAASLIFSALHKKYGLDEGPRRDGT